MVALLGTFGQNIVVIPLVYGQTPSPSTLPTPPVVQATAVGQSATSSGNLNPLLQDALSPTPGPALSLTTPGAGDIASAQLKLATLIRSMLKNSFRADENVTVDVENADTNAIHAAVYDAKGGSTDFEVFTVDNGAQKQVVVKPPAHFKPGKYSIQVQVAGQTYTQDFTWGVLALNTDKSIYLPNESARLQMGVLDENGMVVCDAKVTLVITDPNNHQTTLATDNGKIGVNSECYQHNVTLNPDYESSYQVGGVGNYQMTLSAVTKNGSYTITDSFEVKDSVPFDVQRSTATRIYPPNPYPVDLHITANQDFSGTIAELVPGDFVVDPSNASEYPFHEMSVSETSADQVLGASISGQLVHPFAGQYPIGLEFGQELSDGVEKNIYARFNLAGHDGVDFDMPIGTPLYAVDDGTVALAGPGAYGTTIVIQHAWGRSYYGHLSKVEVKEGQIVLKGGEIGLSGNTGLSTGPHMHFSLKPNAADMTNGYYGKIDPLPFLGIPSTLDPSSQLKLLTWDVTMTKGQKINLGYFYRAPDVSPQFYKLGPLKFYEGTTNIFQEARQWEIASDADGSGTNTVSPTTGLVNATKQIYTFTYTTGEGNATGSGQFTISVPSGWTAPQTSNSGAAGYTTISSASTGTSADILDAADLTSNWHTTGTQATNHKVCAGANPVTDSTAGNSVENGTSLKCDNSGGVTSGDGWYKTIGSTDWTNYKKVGVWMKETGAASVAVAALQFGYSTSSTFATPVETINLDKQLNSGAWTWETFAFGATTRTAIQSFGFNINSSSALDSAIVWVDYILIGPGSPIVTGSGPWTITTNIASMSASTSKIILQYGNGGAGGVTNPSSTGVNTFTTQSMIAKNPNNHLTNIASQPTVTINNGPTNDQLMKHGFWFSGNSKQSFTF